MSQRLPGRVPTSDLLKLDKNITVYVRGVDIFNISWFHVYCKVM